MTLRIILRIWGGKEQNRSKDSKGRRAGNHKGRREANGPGRETLLSTEIFLPKAVSALQDRCSGAQAVYTLHMTLGGSAFMTEGSVASRDCRKLPSQPTGMGYLQHRVAGPPLSVDHLLCHPLGANLACPNAQG
jgi:hypothetical protein